MLRPRRETGFTLVELLITIVLVGIVTAAIGEALISFTSNTDATIQRLGESHDAQISASYFGQDVASIGIRNNDDLLGRSVSTGPSSPVKGCGTVGTSVLWLGWDDPTTVKESTQVWAGYVVEMVSGQRQLHRLVCTGAGVLVSDTVMAHYLSGTPVITCEPKKLGCDDPASIPTSVTMELSIKATDRSASGFTVSLLGTPRQTS